MMDPHFSPLSLGQLRSLPVSGKERAKKGERRVIEMRGQRLKSSASQYQKFHPGFQPHIRKQIHLSHHRSLTPQLYSRWILASGPWQGWSRPNRGGYQWPTQQPCAEAELFTLET